MIILVPSGRRERDLRWLFLVSLSTQGAGLNRPYGTILLSAFCPAMNRRAIVRDAPFRDITVSWFGDYLTHTLHKNSSRVINWLKFSKRQMMRNIKNLLPKG